VPISVAVAGARGEMGRVAIRAIHASEDLRFAGGIARGAKPDEEIFASVDALLAERKPDVLLDFATRPASVEISMAALAHGVRPVVGSSGWTDAEAAELARVAAERGLGAMIVPNFSTGAAVMMRLAEEAARYFPASEIVEMHRVEKKDKPSGTALETASRITRSARTMPEIHSVRLPGLVAHQEVLFAASGEMLTIRHDSFSRDSFVPGILAAVRAVMKLHGLTIGLDAILDEMRSEPFT
jgi:4-hydroxy-tetrahydrodipicolinate reductase